MTGEIYYKLIASEPPGSFKPNHLSLVKAATVGRRVDFYWAEWVKSLDGSFNGIDSENRFVLLASRHQGYSLKDLYELPLDVYVCEVKDPNLLLQEKLEPDDVSILCWALMLPPEDERESISEIYESMKEKKGNLFYINPVHQ